MRGAVPDVLPAAGFRLLEAPPSRDTFAGDVRAGLTASPKAIPPRWFYDALGSALFDAICFLPEYYVLRAETEVLTRHSREIAAAIGNRGRLIELGSGAARKTRILLDAMSAGRVALEYVPVDIDAAMLTRAGRDLNAEYPALAVTAIVGDFTAPAAALGVLPRNGGPTSVLFLGSTIGNFDPAAATTMLRSLRNVLAPGDTLLLGADLRKRRDILEPAYDDALGVTAAFNLNVLARINRELGGHFDLASFRHRAFYDETHGRIEMHLESLRSQRVAIDELQLEIAFAEGETIHTESSYKHDASTIAALAKASGFEVAKSWTDPQGWFADVLLRVGPASSRP